MGLTYAPIPGVKQTIIVVSGTELKEPLQELETRFEKNNSSIDLELKFQGSQDIDSIGKDDPRLLVSTGAYNQPSTYPLFKSIVMVKTLNLNAENNLTEKSFPVKDGARGFESQPNEYSYWIDEIEGVIPRNLQGTLFRNGAGLFDPGFLTRAIDKRE